MNDPLIAALARIAASDRTHPIMRREIARSLGKLDPNPGEVSSSSITATPKDQPLAILGQGEYERRIMP